MKTLLLLTTLASSLNLHAQDPSHVLMDDQPAKSWENDTYPIGNGSIGANLFGGITQACLQFTTDSLWTGNENLAGGYNELPAKPGGDHIGAYQNMGELVFTTQLAGAATITNPSNNELYTPSQNIAATHDDDLTTKWCFVPDDTPIIWQQRFPQPKEITGYTLTTAEDVPDRDPIGWKIEGSNDGESWTLLDEKKDQAPFSARGKAYQFPLKKTARYSQYRLHFTPRPKVSHFQLAEINLDPKESIAKKSDETSYTRKLDLANSIHTTTFKQDGVTYTREAIASHPDKIVAWRFTADKARSISGKITLQGAHPQNETVSTSTNKLKLSGTLINDLKYAAEARVFKQGGNIKTSADHITVSNCDSVLIILAADTNYVMNLSKDWKSGEATTRVESKLNSAEKETWENLLSRHQQDYRALFDRSTIDLGTTPDALAKQPLRNRISNYRTNAQNLPRPCLDPDLEEMLYHYGRYLLISSSRPGTLPANLQGIWNNSNTPPWMADYHTNINVQMNYWLAETTNLSELATPLFDLLDAGIPVYTKHTQLEYGKDGKEVPGFVTRMSLNPFGGGGWNWNIEGTAWLAQHYWTHYLFTGDEKFLENRAYPFLRDVSKFWLTRLKTLPDGRLVVPNAWSHEHGPYEDGTAHAQQLMWDLFTNTIDAADELNSDPAFVKTLTETRAKLVGPKIGSWGQLMEWMEEKPELEKSDHRHTSHLYAVFPGKQINLATTPELAQGAIVSLTQRGEVGNSRQSWAWGWRSALWARLGKPERAHSCIAGLLAYNSFDNLWSRINNGPFQIDGNLGITNGFAEMLLQAHDGQINLLPALTKTWPSGQITGLKTPGGHTVAIKWKDGKLEQALIKKGYAKLPPILIQGQPIKANDPRISLR